MWTSAAIRAAQAAGRAPGGKPGRRTTPKRPRSLRDRVTDPTSRLAIRRSEARRKRGGTRKPWGTQGGPRADARPTGRRLRTSRTTRAAIARSQSRRAGPQPPTSRGPRRPSRTINTGPSRGRRLSSRTSRAAIARSRARLARRR